MAAYIYGSFARGDQRPDSDLDIALLLVPGQHLPNKLLLAQTLYDVSSREVDLLDLRRAGNFVRMEVLREGRLIIDTSPDERLAWEAGAMSLYAHHRESIRGILDSFQHTGIGYHP